MEIFNNLTLIELVTNIVIIIVVLIIAWHFITRFFGNFTGQISKEGNADKDLQRTKYLSWIDRFRDDYEKQIKHVQDFQVNLLKCGLYLLVILICQNTIDSDIIALNNLEKIFFVFSFILFLIMLWKVIKIVPTLLRMAKEIKDFQDRNKISDNGLEIYDKKFYGVTMKDVTGLRKENRSDKYDD